MISIEWNEDKLDSFYQKMSNIIRNMENSVKSGVEDSLKQTQEAALQKKRGSKNPNTIPYNVFRKSKNIVQGRLNTDKDLFSFASFLEYGTGTKAEREHIGKTATFIASGYRYWYLPADKVDREWGSDRIVIGANGRKYYVMFPQAPQPFMRPAAFNMRQKNVESVALRIKDGIKESLS